MAKQQSLPSSPPLLPSSLPSSPPLLPSSPSPPPPLITELPPWIKSCLDRGIPVGQLEEEDENPLIVDWNEKEFSQTATTASLKKMFIKTEMERRKESYIERREFSFLVGSWNVNGQEIASDLSSWLHLHRTTKEPEYIFISLQELDRRPERFVNSTNHSKELAWTSFILQNLNSSSSLNSDSNDNTINNANEHHEEELDYHCISSECMVGIYGAVFVHRKAAVISQKSITSSVAPCGFMGFMGNKGAVGIRFKIGATWIGFISSHLAAHTNQLERRNQDFADICKSLSLVMGSDLVLWAGDLNYRLEVPSYLVIKDIINHEEGRMELLSYCQLKKEMLAGRSFQGFEEAPISFPPTYKYIPGTHKTFDSLRQPAWTDRILWKVNKKEMVLCESESYEVDMTCKASDHKPISSLLKCNLSVINKENWENVLGECQGLLDRWENEASPSTSLSGNEISFGELRWGRSELRSIELKNDGKVIAKYSFISPKGGRNTFPSWIHVTPAEGILLPNQVQVINIYACVDSSIAPMMNDGSVLPETILVLNVCGGSDHFINVHGSFKRTIFCSSLVTMSEAGSFAWLPDANFDDEWRKFEGVPLPLVRIVDWILDNIDERSKDGGDNAISDDLFLESGNGEEIQSFQDSLDEGEPFKSGGPLPLESMAETLLLFLDSLLQPVFPYGFFSMCMERADDLDGAFDVVSRLPPVHQETFEYIRHFLGTLIVAKGGKINKIIPVFAKVMIKLPPKSNPMYNKLVASSYGPRQIERRRVRFLSHFF